MVDDSFEMKTSISNTVELEMEVYWVTQPSLFGLSTLCGCPSLSLCLPVRSLLSLDLEQTRLLLE